MICEDIQLIDKINVSQVSLDLAEVGHVETLERIRKIIKKYPGKRPLYLYLDEQKILAHQKYWVTEDTPFINEMINVLGKGNIWCV